MLCIFVTEVTLQYMRLPPLVGPLNASAVLSRTCWLTWLPQMAVAVTNGLSRSCIELDVFSKATCSSQ